MYDESSVNACPPTRWLRARIRLLRCLLARATVGKLLQSQWPERLLAVEAWTFWHTSGLRRDEFLEFLESIAH
jgi:hypothetical protein